MAPIAVIALVTAVALGAIFGLRESAFAGKRHDARRMLFPGAIVVVTLVALVVLE